MQLPLGIYSNDSIQKSIKEKFAIYNKVYSLKRGFDDFSDTLGIYVVAQPVLAFEGNYSEANRGKNNIFLNQYLYDQIFNRETKARHLLLAYALSCSINKVKNKLKNICAPNAIQEKQLDYFRNLKFKMFLISLISETLPSFTDKDIDSKKACLSQECSKKSLDEIINLLTFPVEIILAILANQLKSQNINLYINDKDKFGSLCKDINSLISVSKITGDQTKFSELSSALWNG